MPISWDFLAQLLGPSQAAQPTQHIFDPAAQRRAALSQALLQFGAGIASAPTLGQGLATGINAAGQGAMAGKQQYRQDQLDNLKMQEYEDEQRRKQQLDLIFGVNQPAIPGSQYASSTGNGGAPDLLAGLTDEQKQRARLMYNLGGEKSATGYLSDVWNQKPGEMWTPASDRDEISKWGHPLPGDWQYSTTGEWKQANKPDGIKIETINRGSMEEQGYFATPGDPSSWVSLSSGPRWAPDKPTPLTDWDKNFALLQQQYPNGIPEGVLLKFAGAAPPDQKAPTGYQWTADGKTLEPISGGPSDPNTIAAIRQAGASEKPMSTEAAKYSALAKQGIEAIDDIKKLSFSDYDPRTNSATDLNRLTLAQIESIPLVGAITISSDARRLWTRAYEMADARLRLTTGAQAPEHEIRATAKAFIPSVMESPAVAMGKLNDLARYFADFMSMQSQPAGALNSGPASPGADPGIPTYDPATGQWSNF